MRHVFDAEPAGSRRGYSRRGEDEPGRERALLLSVALATGRSQARGEGGASGPERHPTIESEKGRLEPLFRAVLQYRSESESDAVVAADGRERAYIGSGDGSVTGDRIRGTIRWSLWSGNCVYPLVRKGQPIPNGIHLCTMNPSGFIETSDGARIRFDGRGYGLRDPDRYRVSLTMVFSTEDGRYAWLTKLLGLMEGEFDEKAGRATWNVHASTGRH
jgi:hypothetical protein